MTDDLRFTRRGVLQMMSAVLATASFAARRPVFASSLIEPEPLLDSEVVDDEQFITDAARGAKIECFLRSRGIRPAQLARESGYSRQHLLRIRLGRIVPSSRCAAQLVAACRRLTREAISAADLFDLSSTDIRAIERHGRSAE